MEQQSRQLKNLFREAHAIFNQRVRQLGNLKCSLSNSDREALVIMLGALIEARKEIEGAGKK